MATAAATDARVNSTHCTVSEVATEADFTRLCSSLPAETLLVIYFHAPWAEPCRQMSPVISVLASMCRETTPPQITFISIHAEELPEISEQYDVTQVPYVVLQKGGRTVETVSGCDRARLRTAVERHIGTGSVGDNAGLPPLLQVTRTAGADTATSRPTANGANGITPKEALTERLSRLVRAAPVMLFMKGTPNQPQCGFSRQTVALLRSRNIRYGFFNILADDNVRQGLKELSDWPTYPQLWVRGELIGGLDIVRHGFEIDPDFLMEYSATPELRGALPQTTAAP